MRKMTKQLETQNLKKLFFIVLINKIEMAVATEITCVAS